LPLAQFFGQHAYIFHRHTAACPIIGELACAASPDQNYPAGMPFFELHPFHCRADDLVVTLKRGQILLRAPPECRKTVAQPVEASLQRIVEARLDDVRETAGAPGHP
jgi:hypothetical protein